mmetsp:Transcript_14053/g.18220  ORF Transcript_14053/g.18220 Transcript_14053/m.18220 type:complete len:468 (-) Transcript_14053:123-1526(-)
MYLFVLLFVASSLENGDEVLVPASYHAIGESLGVSVALLGSLTFGRSVLQTGSSPLVAPFIDLLPRHTVLGLSCIAWGVCTFCTGWSFSYYLLFIFRALTGICLAFAIPTIRSLMSSLTTKQNRVKGFSLLYFGSNVGALFWGMVATSAGDKEFFHIKGWRFVFTLFAASSTIVGALLVKASRSATEEGNDNQTSQQVGIRKLYADYYASAVIILKKKTFILIALQGVVGSMPWKAFSYLPLILQRASFSGEEAAIIVGCFQLGVAGGTVLGGLVADFLRARFPEKGYIITAQLSASSQFPLSYLCIRYFPFEEEYVYHLCVSFFVFGLFISWCGAVNAAMFSEICPEHMRNAVYALNYAVEGSISSAIIPVIGFLSDTEAEITEAGDPLAINVFRICIGASIWLLIVYSLLYAPYARETREVAKLTPKYASVQARDRDRRSSDDPLIPSTITDEENGDYELSLLNK